MTELFAEQVLGKLTNFWSCAKLFVLGKMTMHLLVSFAFGFEILVGSSTKQTSRYWWLCYS